MTNMPDYELIVKGVVAAMLGLFSACLLSPSPATGQDGAAAAGANIVEEQPRGTLKAGMAKTVMVLRVEDVSGTIIGLITNHAGHPVAWGHRELGISCDYPGYALDVVEVPIRKNLPERMQERVAKAKEEQKPPELGQRGSVYDAVAAGKETLRTEVQVLRLGDYFVVGLPSEVFVEYQMEIRDRSGADFSFVSELANDSISYVCTPRAYEEGGYEVRSSSLAPEAGQALVDAAIGLVDDLK